MIADSVKVLKSNSNAKVYIDAGHAFWHTPKVMTDRLQKSGIAQADGFVLNVSNFVSTLDNIAYGNVIANTTGKKFYY